MPRKELTQDEVLLRSAEKPGAGLPAVGSSLAQDPEPQCLVSPGERLSGCTCQPGRDAIAQISGCGSRSSKHQTLVGGYPVLVNPVNDDLDGGGRLARARSAENPQNAFGMLPGR
jgi:hypothetical protein